jgi:putative membrane protein
MARTAQKPQPIKAGLDVSTRLAVERTHVAYERTMLSWIRTATSLITFGFGVYKFFQIERSERLQKYFVGPQEFGLVLVAIGLLSLLLATWEFRRNIHTLGLRDSEKLHSPTVVLAGSISILGVTAFIVMLLRQ